MSRLHPSIWLSVVLIEDRPLDELDSSSLAVRGLSVLSSLEFHCVVVPVVVVSLWGYRVRCIALVGLTLPSS